MRLGACDRALGHYRPVGRHQIGGFLFIVGGFALVDAILHWHGGEGGDAEPGLSARGQHACTEAEPPRLEEPTRDVVHSCGPGARAGYGGLHEVIREHGVRRETVAVGCPVSRDLRSEPQPEELQ